MFFLNKNSREIRKGAMRTKPHRTPRRPSSYASCGEQLRFGGGQWGTGKWRGRGKMEKYQEMSKHLRFQLIIFVQNYFQLLSTDSFSKWLSTSSFCNQTFPKNVNTTQKMLAVRDDPLVGDAQLHGDSKPFGFVLDLGLEVPHPHQRFAPWTGGWGLFLIFVCGLIVATRLSTWCFSTFWSFNICCWRCYK